MYCPQCNAEYVEGVTQCADCEVELVAEPSSAEDQLAYVDYKQVLATYNPGDVAFLKSVLDSRGIEYYFDGEDFLYSTPMVQPAQLLVRPDDFERTIELIKPLHLTGASLAHDEKPEGIELDEEEGPAPEEEK